ncbi:MAG: PIG-L deacetylase family protein [Chloroflexota bacterium]|nr:PIG-L deacetylase family protein [Chloroflexota bacterium]
MANNKKTVLVIVAHADDMEFMAGGTIAKMADRGHDIHEVIATNNERGTLEPAWSQELAAEARQEEARRGAKVLGVQSVEFLGYEDGRLSETPLNELREKCMRAMRRVRPHIIFTWDPFANYENHQDHRAVAWATIEAASFCHFPLYHPEHRDEGLEPHYVGEHYYFAKVPQDVNKIVDISDYIDRKLESLYEHKSQMVLTVTDFKLALEASGLRLPAFENIDPQNYRPLIAQQIKAWAATVGRKINVVYGEEFRRVRFGGIERWLGEQALEEDT